MALSPSLSATTAKAATLGSAAGATAPIPFGTFNDFAGVSAALLLVAWLAIATVPPALQLAPHIKEGTSA